jgi:aspartyl-tRNA(Asn)/glutamyl-tRNA(Gln) amidotransferase subunit A
MTADELRHAFATGGLSATDIVTQFLDRIEHCDGRVGAFVQVDAEGALAQAELLDRRRVAGEPLGPLAAVPVAVKDNLCARGTRTTCASRMLESFVPPYDATVIERLRAADAVLIGRTNLDEFAMGSTCENSAFQVTRNPWDLSRTPGGSSGGSAAAVAAGMSPLALGSDTGGSIRQPAAFCGVVGLKPTYGRVSRYGLVAFASSLDQVGPFARDVTGAARLLDVIAGRDPRDTTCVDLPAPAVSDKVDRPISGLRIGLVREHFAEGLNGDVERSIRDAVDVFRGLGAAVREVSLPHAACGVAVYYIVSSCEASSNLARYDGVHYGHRSRQFQGMIDMYGASRGEAFGPEVKRRIMLGTYALSAGYYDAYYLKALQVRRLVRRDFDAVFQDVDVIVGPVAPTPAFALGELVDDPLAMYLGDIYTISANLAGLPALSIPCGPTPEGLPVGLQLWAAPFEEERLLRAARMFERATDWHTRRPQLPDTVT